MKKTLALFLWGVCLALLFAGCEEAPANRRNTLCVRGGTPLL